VTLPLVVLIGVLFAVGVYLVLQRNLTRVLVGLGVLAHAVNVMLITSGEAGTPPIVAEGAGPYADPLPQALILTAIVITFGVTAFLLGLALRGWAGVGDDVVEDDLEDRRIQRSRRGGPK
jgi:multicomponent Na+:H+ antiporter subunit C